MSHGAIFHSATCNAIQHLRHVNYLIKRAGYEHGYNIAILHRHGVAISDVLLSAKILFRILR